MHFTYSKIPNEYAMNLMINGKREKARSFLEYAFDISQNVQNSIRFYASSWGKTRHTTKAWIDDFNKEINYFNKYWEAKNISQEGYQEGTNWGTTKGTENRALSDTFQPIAIHQVSQEVGQSKYINNNKSISGKKQVFSAPTIEEIKHFIETEKLKIKAEAFFYHYEANGWMVGKNKMKSWQSALRNWNTRERQSQKKVEVARYV